MAMATARIASSTECMRPSLFRSGIVQGLHAERDAVDAGLAIAAKTRRLDARRIGFERHLDLAIDRPDTRDRLEDRADRPRLHERGRAAAEEDAGHHAARRKLAHMGKLGLEGANEARLVGRRMAHMAVEIAIRAFGEAERPMDIDAEARITRGMRRRAGLLQGGGRAHRFRLLALEAGARERDESASPVRERAGLIARRPVDAVLFLRRHLAEGRVVPVGLEHRVVAEASLPARRPDEMAVHAAFEQLLMAIRPGDHESGDEMRAPLARRESAKRRASSRSTRSIAGRKSLFTAQSAEKSPGAPSSASTQSPKSSARAGIPVALRRRTRLDRRILAEHMARFGRDRQIELAGRDRFHTERGQELAHLGELSRIMRGDHDAALEGAMARLAHARLSTIEHRTVRHRPHR